MVTIVRGSCSSEHAPQYISACLGRVRSDFPESVPLLPRCGQTSSRTRGGTWTDAARRAGVGVTFLSNHPDVSATTKAKVEKGFSAVFAHDTTVELGGRPGDDVRMGRAAADMVLSMLGGAGPRTVTLPTTHDARDTTRPIPRRAASER
jgi:hypothetical protein